MRHPSQTDLALYAGGDLAWPRQMLTEQHVRRCSECQEIASGFSELRSAAEYESVNPQVNWTRLSSEMKANIRLGLAAGECVTPRQGPRSFVSGARLAVVGGFLTVLIAVGAWVNRPDLRSALWARSASGTVLEASESGIQVRGTQQTLRILNPAARNVMYSVGSQGELRARSLDPETGNVAITHVYGE